MTTDPLARLLPSGVSLCGVTYNERMVDPWTEWLSDEEVKCIESFGAEKRRREFLAGRAAARRLLAAHLDVPPGRVPLRRAEDDAVDVESGDWHVSIAHSGPHALAACARHPIGVDLEQIQVRDAGVARFLLHTDERGLIDALPFDSDSALILCWTLKEAVLKARRSGLRTSPKQLSLTVESERCRARVEVEGNGFWNVHFAELVGYWGAVALPDA